MNAWSQVKAVRGVMNGPLKFLRARKILPSLDVLAKFNECTISHVRKIFVCKANFKSMLVLARLFRSRVTVATKIKENWRIFLQNRLKIPPKFSMFLKIPKISKNLLITEKSFEKISGFCVKAFHVDVFPRDTYIEARN